MLKGPVCYKLPNIYNKTILNQIFMLFSLKNTSFFTVFSCIIQNTVVSVWCYHLPFFSNVETQMGNNTFRKYIFHLFYSVFKLYSNLWLKQRFVMWLCAPSPSCGGQAEYLLIACLRIEATPSFTYLVCWIKLLHRPPFCAVILSAEWSSPSNTLSCIIILHAEWSSPICHLMLCHYLSLLNEDLPSANIICVPSLS